MKIGIFGTGMVGRILAEKFIYEGNEVMLGTRNVAATLSKDEKDILGNPPYKEWQQTHQAIQLGSFKETAKFGDIIFIATFGNTALNAIVLAGKDNFNDKIVVDVTNPLDVSQGVPPVFTGALGNSLGEQIQKELSNAKVVKAFNTLSMHIIVNPKREEGDPVILIAGNDEVAKENVTAIAKNWGWKDVVDFGDISESFWLETFGMLWIRYAFKNNSWTHAFKLIRK
ncbi:MAG: NAD(P)-binding domain-containing protein [Chitinophagaceae bacterium]|nr:NAD(P)-binding domain-containing protein [Chitinophagaceae bacterium]